MESRKKVTTTLPPELFTKIKVQAAKEGRPLSDILEELITQYLAAPHPVSEK